MAGEYRVHMPLEPTVPKRPAIRLGTMSQDEKETVMRRLLTVQNGRCMICEKDIDLATQRVDVDHIRALSRGGVDDENNWAVAHESCNKSKGSRDLQLQRYVYVLREHIGKYTETSRAFTVGEALSEFYPEREEVDARVDRDSVSLTFNEDGKRVVERFALLPDPTNLDIRSFVGMVPFIHLFHDRTMNPRSIVDVEPLVVEFYGQVPQLQPSLATLTVPEGGGRAQILLFDGQHKAAAQLYIHSPRLFVRVFLNCDKNLLKEANFRAHTSLAQIHFPQATADKVGHDIFAEAFAQYLLKADHDSQTEAEFFDTTADADARTEYQSYFKHYLRYEVLTGKFLGAENGVLEYVEMISPRSRRFPLSYDALEKGLISQFLSYNSPTSMPLKESLRYRDLERGNLVGLTNLFTEEVLAGKFNLRLGVYKLEQKVIDDPDSVPDDHLRAFRMCKKPALATWVSQLSAAIASHLAGLGKYRYSSWPQERPLWVEMRREDWDLIRKMIRVAAQHKCWIEKRNPDILRALESTRHKDWKEILIEGKLPGRQQPIFAPMNHNYLLENARAI